MSASRRASCALAVPGRPEERRQPSAVGRNLDGTLTHRDTLLPFLRRVGGPLRTSRAVAAAAGRHLAGGRDSAGALLLQLVLGGRTTAGTDAIGRRSSPSGTSARCSARIRSSARGWRWSTGASPAGRPGAPAAAPVRDDELLSSVS